MLWSLRELLIFLFRILRIIPFGLPHSSPMNSPDNFTHEGAKKIVKLNNLNFINCSLSSNSPDINTSEVGKTLLICKANDRVFIAVFMGHQLLPTKGRSSDPSYLYKVSAIDENLHVEMKNSVLIASKHVRSLSEELTKRLNGKFTVRMEFFCTSHIYYTHFLLIFTFLLVWS